MGSNGSTGSKLIRTVGVVAGLRPHTNNKQHVPALLSEQKFQFRLRFTTKFDNGDKRFAPLYGWGTKSPHTRDLAGGDVHRPVVVADFFRHVRFSVRFPPGDQQAQLARWLIAQTGRRSPRNISCRQQWGGLWKILIKSQSGWGQWDGMAFRCFIVLFTFLYL